MNKFTSLLGDKLQTKHGEVDTTTALSGLDAVAIYNSEPHLENCQEFNEVLLKKYNALKAAGKKFEIVNISGRTYDSYWKQYFAVMPWLSIPAWKCEKILLKLYSETIINDKLPILVIFDGASGEKFTMHGKEMISEENFIESFPWKPIPMSINQFPAELLKNSVVEKISIADALKGVDTLGIFFCKKNEYFSKNLIPEQGKRYNTLKEAGKKLEIIFASADKDKADFDEHFAEMPWFAMPFEFRKEYEALSKRYEYENERRPHLVFINLQTWETITLWGMGGDGDGVIFSEYFLENFPYYSKNSYDISEKKGEDEGIFSKEKNFQVFTDHLDLDSQKAVYNTVREIADAAKAKGDHVIYRWFTSYSVEEGKEMRPAFNLESSFLRKDDYDMTIVTKEENDQTNSSYVCSGCNKEIPRHTEFRRSKDGKQDCMHPNSIQYCQTCYTEAHSENNGLKATLPMLIMNISEMKFWRPLEGKREFTKENVQAFLDDLTSGKLKEEAVKNC